MALIVIGAEVDQWYSHRYAEEDATVADKADDKVDAGKDPFVAKMSVAMDDSYAHESWALPRSLTPEERQRLSRLIGAGEDPEAVRRAIWTVVSDAGARRIMGAAAIYDLQVTSERKNSVVVTRITAEATRCWKPEGKVWISTGTGGLEGWEDISFDLKKGVEAPAMETTGDPNNPSYERFEDVISVGGQQTPGFIKVLPFAIQKSCEFKVNLYYNVNSGKTRKKTISEDEKGEKLVFHAAPMGVGVETWTWIGGDNFDVAVQRLPRTWNMPSTRGGRIAVLDHPASRSRRSSHSRYQLWKVWRFPRASR
ncbi:hypothetical protein [Streptomyces cadmiisoli]|uniref:hypothetical protein n=1 Tax=Streptomyces cadmiisoli TaxID=2184053 RepID=UPI003D765510